MVKSPGFEPGGVSPVVGSSPTPSTNMKILFLDIDGVVNCARTYKAGTSNFPLDPYMAFLVARIVEATGCKVVLSSSWRYHEESAEQVRQRVVDFIDVTPKLNGLTSRGTEIDKWLEAHPEVTKYAILDDNSDMLEEQMPNFFLCPWETGLTDEIAQNVIDHLEYA